MARGSTKKVDGTVSAYKLRRSKSDSWAHEYTVGSGVYTHFSPDEGALMQVGDRVRFDAVERQLRGGSRSKYFAISELTVEVQSVLAPHGSDQGYIYVMTNSSMKGLRKIGYTRDTPGARARALSGNTGVPGKFKEEWSLLVNGDPQRIERAVHARLAHRHHNKEFFRVSADEARDAIQLAYAELYPQAKAKMDAALRSRAEEMERARAEAADRVNKERERIADERRKATRGYRWLTEGALDIGVLTEFNGPAASALPRGFWKALFGAPKTFHNQVAVEIRGGVDARGGHVWSIAAEGWHAEKSLNAKASGAHLEFVIDKLEAILGGQKPDRMNVKLHIPAALLQESPQPPETRIGYDLVYSASLQETLAFRILKKDDIYSACMRIRAIARRESLPSPEKVRRAMDTNANATEARRSLGSTVQPDSHRQTNLKKRLDARGRPAYPWGCKVKGRELLRKSGMTEGEIDLYLDGFAD